MVDTIIFDLNNVLVTYKDSLYNDKFEEEIGFSIQKFWDAGKKYYHNYNIGKENMDNFFLYTMKDLSIPETLFERTKHLFMNCFSEVNGIRDILEKLKKDFRLILLAGDGKESIKHKVKEMNFEKYFSAVYATCFEGVDKIEPEIYKKVIEKEKLDPKNTLFIDDTKEFLEVAESFGIKTILFTDSEQLKEELKKFGINV